MSEKNSQKKSDKSSHRKNNKKNETGSERTRRNSREKFECDNTLSGKIASLSYIFFNGVFIHGPICYRLTVKLIQYLYKGSMTWIVMLVRLIFFSIFLIPGWIGVFSMYSVCLYIYLFYFM